MTLNGLQSMQEIVNNFLELKEKISQTSPNTKLQIVENVVVSTKEGENPEFYVLEGNDWNLAKVNEYLPQNIQQETTKDSLLEVESIDTSNIQKENNNFLAIISNNPSTLFILLLASSKILSTFAKVLVNLMTKTIKHIAVIFHWVTLYCIIFTMLKQPSLTFKHTFCHENMSFS